MKGEQMLSILHVANALSFKSLGSVV